MSDKSEFGIDDAIEIQREHLDQWKTILKPEVYESLEEYALRENHLAKRHQDIKRGTNLDNYIGNYMLGHRFENGGKVDCSHYVYKFYGERDWISASVVCMESDEEVWEYWIDDAAISMGETTLVEDGFMKHWDDIIGLENYLKSVQILPQNADLISEEEANNMGYYAKGGTMTSAEKNAYKTAVIDKIVEIGNFPFRDEPIQMANEKSGVIAHTLSTENPLPPEVTAKIILSSYGHSTHSGINLPKAKYYFIANYGNHEIFHPPVYHTGNSKEEILSKINTYLIENHDPKHMWQYKIEDIKSDGSISDDYGWLYTDKAEAEKSIKWLNDNDGIDVPEAQFFANGGEVGRYTIEQYFEDYSTNYGNPYKDGYIFEVYVHDDSGEGDEPRGMIWGESEEEIHKDIAPLLKDQQAITVKQWSFAKGGSFGKAGRARDMRMRSNEPHEKNYKRKTRAMKYAKGGEVDLPLTKEYYNITALNSAYGSMGHNSKYTVRKQSDAIEKAKSWFQNGLDPSVLVRGSNKRRKPHEVVVQRVRLYGEPFENRRMVTKYPKIAKDEIFRVNSTYPLGERVVARPEITLNEYAKGGEVNVPNVHISRVHKKFMRGEIEKIGDRMFKVENDILYTKDKGEDWQPFRKIVYANGGEIETYSDWKKRNGIRIEKRGAYEVAVDRHGFELASAENKNELSKRLKNLYMFAKYEDTPAEQMYAKGGSFGKAGRARDMRMRSNEPHEKNYKRKTKAMSYARGGNVPYVSHTPMIVKSYMYEMAGERFSNESEAEHKADALRQVKFKYKNYGFTPEYVEKVVNYYEANKGDKHYKDVSEAFLKEEGIIKPKKKAAPKVSTPPAKKSSKSKEVIAAEKALKVAKKSKVQSMINEASRKLDEAYAKEDGNNAVKYSKKAPKIKGLK
jgi:hypothetical protein